MKVIPPNELEFVERAARALEHPSFLVQLADLVGAPLEGLVNLAPDRVSRAVTLALRRSLDVAVWSLPGETESALPEEFSGIEDRAWWTGYRHAAWSALSGGVGGLFGTAGLCVELPITTCLMLRSMSSIARGYGENMDDLSVRLECLSLFAAGGPSQADDEMDSSYLSFRVGMNPLVKHAAKYVAHTPRAEVVASIKNGTAPALVKLIGKVGQRFEVAVSEKLLAQAIPLVGAVGGASINVLFAQHFNRIARYHFGLRYLERRWGRETVRAMYDEAAAPYREARSRDRDRHPRLSGTEVSGRLIASTKTS